MWMKRWAVAGEACTHIAHMIEQAGSILIDDDYDDDDDDAVHLTFTKQKGNSDAVKTRTDHNKVEFSLAIQNATEDKLNTMASSAPSSSSTSLWAAPSVGDQPVTRRLKRKSAPSVPDAARDAAEPAAPAAAPLNKKAPALRQRWRKKDSSSSSSSSSSGSSSSSDSSATST